jgi:hypothetical protein
MLPVGTRPHALDKWPGSGDDEVVLCLDGEPPLVVHDYRRRIMSEDVTDKSLLDLRGLGMCEAVDESALTGVLTRILASAAEGPSISFQASI